MAKNFIAKGIAFAAVLFFSAAPAVHAASMHLSPQSGTYHKGQNFSVGVLVSSDISINAVSGVLTFPAANLEVIGVNKNNSVIDLWVQEPSFSNSNTLGNVQFEGVALNPGFVGQNGRIINISFRVKNTGSAQIDFLESAILANDGLGTNIGELSTGSRFVLAPPSAPSVVVPQKTSTAKEGDAITSPAESGVLGYWGILPGWIQVAVLGLVGTATVVLSLIVLFFGIIVLVWMWYRLWPRRTAVVKEMHSIPGAVKKIFSAVAGGLWRAEREIKGDIAYSAGQIKKEVLEAKNKVAFREVMAGYWYSTVKIFRRFTRVDSKK